MDDGENMSREIANASLGTLRQAIASAKRQQQADTDHPSFCVVSNRTVTAIIEAVTALDSLAVSGILPEQWKHSASGMVVTADLSERKPTCKHSAEHVVTCGACGGSWCDKCNPIPSARCLYEYDH